MQDPVVYDAEFSVLWCSIAKGSFAYCIYAGGLRLPRPLPSGSRKMASLCRGRRDHIGTASSASTTRGFASAPAFGNGAPQIGGGLHSFVDFPGRFDPHSRRRRTRRRHEHGLCRLSFSQETVRVAKAKQTSTVTSIHHLREPLRRSRNYAGNMILAMLLILTYQRISLLPTRGAKPASQNTVIP